MDRFGIVIVTYNPNKVLLEENICRYAKVASYVVIINNSKSLDINIDSYENVRIISLNKNMGIAYAQNRGVQELNYLNIEYVFLSDQDSTFPIEYFENMLEEWNCIKKNDTCIGALAPLIYDRNKKDYLPIYYYSDKVKILKDKNPDISLRKTMPIASGLLTKVDIYRNIGGNEDDLFIDWVDIDFDWRLLEKGFNVYTTPNVKMSHTLGNIEEKRLLFRTYTIMNHSPMRDYYYFRNGIYLIYKYKKSNLNVHTHIKKSLSYKFKDMLLEPNTGLRLKKIIKAVFDGRKMAKKKKYI